MRKFLLIGVLLLTCPFAAQASDYCADVFDGFAAEMDRIAAAYDKMTTTRDVCTYGRNTTIPTVKRILATTESIQGRCRNGAGAVKFARDNMQKWATRVSQDCRKAGM